VAATLFVRNLAFSCQEADLRAFFASAGEAVEIRFGEGADGRPRGFAHVEFRDAAAAAAAAALSGGLLLDREVRCEAASAPVGGGAGRPPAAGEAAAGCWFCLSTGKDTHLVVSVAGETYMALDKGALSDRHVLLLPVEHAPSTTALPLSAAAELWRYQAALRQLAAPDALICFERHLALRSKGGNHAHLNCLPLPAAAAAQAQAAFESAAAAAGVTFAHLPPCPDPEAAARQLAAAVPMGAEYFCATLADGARLVHVHGGAGRLGLQFGREVLAGLLGDASRADWRNCVLDEAGEEARAGAFRTAFAAVDPFAEG
jgi:diadenosine tetraphosphate (Ap4A) HIT family hydrolase